MLQDTSSSKIWKPLLPSGNIIVLQDMSTHKISKICIRKIARYNTYKTYPILPSGKSIGIMAIPAGVGPLP